MGQYEVRHQCDFGGPDGFLPDGTPVYFKFGRGSCKSTLMLQMYADLMGIPKEEFYRIMYPSNSNLCVDCEHFYQEFTSCVYCCSAGHNDIVGRYREACEDFKEDI
jgi:hypothetical protein